MIHSNHSNFFLLKGLRGLIVHDEYPIYRDLFKQYVECSPTTSLVYSLINSHTVFRISSATLFYILNYLIINKDSKNPFVTMISHANEKAAFDQFVQCKSQVSLFKKSFTGLFSYHARKISLKSLLKIARITKYLLKKHELYVVLRSLEYMASYSKMNNYICKENLKAVLLLSDGNPHGFALIFLAYKYNTPLIFIAHGEPPEGFIYPLDCDIAFLLGPSSRQKYEAVGSHFNTVVYKGHKECYRAFECIDNHKPLTLGIFLSKFSSLEHIRPVLNLMAQKININQILIRRHSNADFYKKVNLNKIVPPGIRQVASGSFREDVEQCDLILTGISTSLLEVIMHGKACLYCKELDRHKVDIYNYVRDDLTIGWYHDLSVEEINRFFQKMNRARIAQNLDLNQTFTESIEQLNKLVFDFDAEYEKI